MHSKQVVALPGLQSGNFILLGFIIRFLFTQSIGVGKEVKAGLLIL